MTSVCSTILGIFTLVLKVQFFTENLYLCHYHVSQNRNMVSPVKYNLLYNSPTSLTTCSFLRCLTKSQISLTSTSCVNLQNFILCSSMSRTVHDPTLWVLDTFCTDVLLSCISTICCTDNTGFCLHALFSWVVFRSKHGSKLILAQNSEIYTCLAPGLRRTKL